ncbi:hypothetical protein DFH09DRAFT_1097270 [Mycena vulgaris]|nr:hypothetical protein DFH09DRAFT_1097270 [Mycena vulgaris]
MTKLLQELIDGIVTEVEDADSLKACALAASSLRVPSQRILLHSLVLLKSERNSERLVYATHRFPASRPFGFRQLLARPTATTHAPFSDIHDTPASTPRGTTREPSSSQPTALTKYHTEGRKNLEQKANDAPIELFACCGIPPRATGREEFTHFLKLDDEDVYKFQRDLTRLGSVLIPFARAIQCLESKDTNPADVYLYWLAIVAQLNDLISKDDDAVDKQKYATTVKELIRSIANFQFSHLIEEERASKTIEELAVQPVTLSFPAGQLTMKEGLPLIQRIGLSLQKILQTEYSAEYRPDHTVQEAEAAMMEINPYIAHLTWMNSDLRNKQQVLMVSNYLVIQGFSRMNSKKEALSKPVTVNWRDIQETIHGKLKADPINIDESDDLRHQPSSTTNRTSSKHFDLAAEFDIQWYLHILANKIEGPTVALGPAHSENEVTRGNSLGSSNAVADMSEKSWIARNGMRAVPLAYINVVILNTPATLVMPLPVHRRDNHAPWNSVHKALVTDVAGSKPTELMSPHVRVEWGTVPSWSLHPIMFRGRTGEAGDDSAERVVGMGVRYPRGMSVKFDR